jgi:cellulose biosynthesis protein BcsQ
VTLVDLDPQQGLSDIAAFMGCPDGVLTKRLRLSTAGLVPARGPRAWVLVDTPPALDGSLPALNESDYLVIPVIPEVQEVAQLEKFLAMLNATRHSRPFAQTIGVLPVRYTKHWLGHRACLAAIGELAERAGVPLLEPVPSSQAVSRYSLAGGLWRPMANMVSCVTHRPIPEPHTSESYNFTSVLRPGTALIVRALASTRLTCASSRFQIGRQ